MMVTSAGCSTMKCSLVPRHIIVGKSTFPNDNAPGYEATMKRRCGMSDLSELASESTARKQTATEQRK